MKLDNSPIVKAPLRTRTAPYAISETFTKDGVPSTKASNIARALTARILASFNFDEIDARRTCSRSSAPKALTTMTPSKLS